MEEFSEATAPGAFVTDLLPQLSYLPVWLQWWRPRAQRYYQHQHNLWIPIWRELKEKVKKGCAPSCFAKHLLEADMKRYGLEDIQAAFLAGSKLLSISFRPLWLVNSFCLRLVAYFDFFSIQR